jgi:hypothetical protein
MFVDENKYQKRQDEQDFEPKSTWSPDVSFSCLSAIFPALDTNVINEQI